MTSRDFSRWRVEWEFVSDESHPEYFQKNGLPYNTPVDEKHWVKTMNDGTEAASIHLFGSLKTRIATGALVRNARLLKLNVHVELLEEA